jgi:type I restriction enzyme S subunit
VVTWTSRTLAAITDDGGMIRTGPFGSQLKQTQYSSTGVPVIMPKDIRDGRVTTAEIARVPEETAQRLDRHRVAPGAIVFPRRGDIAKCALIREHQKGWLCGTGCLQIRVSPKTVIPAFLYYFLRSQEAIDWLLGHATGSTMRNLSENIIRNLPVRSPSVEEQQKIVAILGRYDELIDNNRRRMALLEDAARQLYREWFVRLRFPGHETTEIVNSIPEGWRRAVLREICAAPDGIQTGPFGSQLHQSDYVTEGIPVVMPKDMKTSKIDERQVARVPETKAEALVRHRMRPGDIVYGRRGEIGRRALISQRQSGWLCGTGCLRLRVNATKVLSRFLFDTLGHPDVHGTIAARAQGATLPNLSAGILSAIPVALPPMELQQRYESIVKPMTVQIETLALQSDRLHQARDLLLPRLMRGDLQP